MKLMLLLLASLTSNAVFAHAGHEHHPSALLSGLLHLLSGLDHGLLALGLGVLLLLGLGLGVQYWAKQGSTVAVRVLAVLTASVLVFGQNTQL